MLTSLFIGKDIHFARKRCSPPQKTVCITGHREKAIIPFRNDMRFIDITRATVKLMLFKYIDMAIESGYTDFFSGLADGTDLWAAEYVILKKQKRDLRLIGAVPYLRHSFFMSRDSKYLLRRVEEGADDIILMNSDPNIVYSRSGRAGTSDSLYKTRNYFMADNSSAVIAFFDSSRARSGTAQTVNRALQAGLKVCSFGLSDVYGILEASGINFKNIHNAIRSLENVF